MHSLYSRLHNLYKVAKELSIAEDDPTVLHTIMDAMMLALPITLNTAAVDTYYHRWLENTHAPALDAEGAFYAGWQASAEWQKCAIQELESEKLPMPKHWHTELAATCFAKNYNGEGSYYCPHCDINAGSVWTDHAWRPTKYQALCYKCRELFKEVT